MITHINIYTILLTAFSSIFAMEMPAQQNQFKTSSDSDPEATKILENMVQYLESMDAYSMVFDFEATYPDGTKNTASAKLEVSKKAYRFEMSDQLVVCDGVYVWYYLKGRNEVQINDMDDEGQNVLSPAYFLQFYQSDDYVSAITNEQMAKNGVRVVRVDFKPVSQFSEFKKIGIDLVPSEKKIKSLLILTNDNSRFYLDKISITKQTNLPPGTFKFDVSKYPGIHLEDLRMN